MELAPAGTLPTPPNFLVAWTAMTVTRRWWLAATGVLLAIIAAGIVLATGVILLPVHTSGSTAVPLTVISRSGPGSPIVGGSLKILAATSVDDVQGTGHDRYGIRSQPVQLSGHSMLDIRDDRSALPADCPF